MKKTIAVLPVLIAGLGLMLAGRLTAQTYTNLHAFSGGSDGATPLDGLILSGKTLYGVAGYGGWFGSGTVFAINTDGTGFTNLYFLYSYSDGAYSRARLVLSGNTLYGTAYQGGSYNAGTVFAVNTNGTGFTNLHSFTSDSGYPYYTNSDGDYPLAGLVLSGNTLYGTAQQGGSFGDGTVFAINTDGTGFTNLHSFTAVAPYPYYNNSDGAYPTCQLIVSGNTLYGTALNGGSSGSGTVFAINTDGTGFTNLYSFLYLPCQTCPNSGGAYPEAGLILSGDTLYGTAARGGSSGWGTVFKVNTNGAGFTTLHNFTAVVDNGNFSYTNSDGADPEASLILSGNTLYGMARQGGSNGLGTVFAVNTNGTGFTTLYTCTGSGDGIYSHASLILSGNTLYGTAPDGGASRNGVVFSLSFPPQLTIVPSGSNVILSWPSNFAGFSYAGYSLQSAPALPGTFTNIASATSPYTNPISGEQQFFRLISN